jgi:hypothetical protein
MSAVSKIRYLGWSSFAIESANGNLLFDPFYRELCGATWSRLDDFQGAKVICVTHGHAEHYVDVPVILKNTDAVIVGSNEVCRHLNTKYKVKKKRLRPINPFEEISVSGFKITAFEWGHREVSTLRVIRDGVLRANIYEVLRFAWLNLFKAPYTTSYFGFFVECPDNIRLMNYCEGFSDIMKIGEIRNLGQRFKTDVLLAGMQLDFEEYAAQGTAALSPKTLILFSPHEALFDKIGLKSSPAQTFVDKISEVLPEVKIIIAKPQTSFTISSLT